MVERTRLAGRMGDYLPGVPIMLMDVDLDEQRGFGRQTDIRYAWVLFDNQHRVACAIRNISPDGALLAFDCRLPEVNEFLLLLDQESTAVKCMVRHRQEQAIGVHFGMAVPPALQDRRAENASFAELKLPSNDFDQQSA